MLRKMRHCFALLVVVSCSTLLDVYKVHNAVQSAAAPCAIPAHLVKLDKKQ